MVSFYLVFLVMLSLSACTSTNSAVHRQYSPPDSDLVDVSHGMPSEPGKCYAKCFVPDQYEINEEQYVIYTGDASIEGVDVDTLILVTEPASSKWAKIKDPNCHSANIDDCMSWGIEDTPEVKEVLHVLTDTLQSDSYIRRTISVKSIPKKGGFSEWREVICNADVTPEVIIAIQQALVKHGYDIGTEGLNGKINAETKKALLEFQRNNNLPSGQIDMDTITALDKIE